MKTLIPSRFVSFLGLLLLSTMPLHATQIFLELEGAAYGDIEGDPSVATLGGVDVSTMIECDAFEWELVQPIDFASFQPTGDLQMRAMKLVKTTDQSTPLLIDALSHHQVVSGTFHFFEHDADSGETVHASTIEFENAYVVHFRTWRPHRQDPASAPFRRMDEVQIIAEKMVFADLDSGHMTLLTNTVRGG